MALTHNSMDKLRTLVQNRNVAKNAYNDALMKQDFHTAEELHSTLSAHETELAWLQYENNVNERDFEQFVNQER